VLQLAWVAALVRVASPARVAAAGLLGRAWATDVGWHAAVNKARMASDTPSAAA